MEIEFIKRKIDEKLLEKYSVDAGLPLEESQFHLQSAIELVEQAICKSLTHQTICVLVSSRNGIINLPYESIKTITKIERIDECNGFSCDFPVGNSRLVKNKLFLPGCEDTWRIQYETKPIYCGALEEKLIFLVADQILNGHFPDQDEIRIALRKHHTKTGSIPIDC